MAQSCLSLAQEEATLLDQSVIGTRHLLLGIIREPECTAAKALSTLGVNLNRLRSEASARLTRGDRSGTGEMSLSDGTRDAIEYAMEQAKNERSSRIGTEHLIIGLLATGGSASEIISGFGIEATMLHAAIEAALVTGSPGAVDGEADAVRKYLKEVTETRGYVLEMHRIMASADLDWAKKYDQFIEATYTGQRTLDRKTKELLQIVVETALRADTGQIQAHIRVALQEGATPKEVLEAMQAVIAPMGALAFRRGVQAWAAETGFEPIDMDEG